MDHELAYMPATELAAAIRTRRVSLVEVITALLERIERVNPSVNAFCTVVAEAALSGARKAEAAVMDDSQTIGPLHGVPISFKDLTSTAGIRTTFGSRIFEHYVPGEDAIVVERARRAGAIIVGKTNTPEFGCKSVTDNAIFGHTRNPWNLDRVPGGSSGGAAAALAAGLGLGFAAALGAGRMVAGLLFGVGALDPRTLTGVALLLLATASLAAWVPARRASAVDPQRALRPE